MTRTFACSPSHTPTHTHRPPHPPPATDAPSVCLAQGQLLNSVRKFNVFSPQTRENKHNSLKEIQTVGRFRIQIFVSIIFRFIYHKQFQ